MNDLRKRTDGFKDQHTKSNERYKLDRKHENFIMSKIPLPIVVSCIYPDI